MTFRVRGLDPAPFLPLYGLADDELARLGVRRVVADARPGTPDRIEVRDLEPGERALLLNHEHQPAPTAYRSRHAVFVREGADRALDVAGELPEALRIRPISLRAFDAAGEMVDAELDDGARLEPHVRRMLADPRVAYLHAHYARFGCYAARIERP